MKIALLVILALCAIGISAKFRVPRSVDQVNPAWTCTKLDKTNAKAKDDKADGTKCQYVSYLIETLKQDYGTPQYPSCFAQLDGICDSHIVDYYEKRNIKKFSEKIQVVCQSDDPTWEHFQGVLNAEKEKHTDIFASDYWNCVSDNVDTWVQDEYVTGPSFPAPYLDVLNYVCQQVQADMRNIDRVNFNAWFESQGKFQKLDKVGRSLFMEVKAAIERNDDLDPLLRTCFSFELGQFIIAAVPEVQGYYNTRIQEGTDFQQAYLTFDPRMGDPELPYPQYKQESWNGAEFFGYECWNFYAPKAHYKQPKADNGKDSVTTDSFSGNKGHPLCPDNTMYQPLTRFGPMCCPIVQTFGPPPHTYNCCTASSYQFQQMKYGPMTYPMPPYQECAPCTCLDGYQMVFDIDYFGLGEPRGGCQQIKK